MFLDLESYLKQKAKQFAPRAAAAIILFGCVVLVWSVSVEPWRQRYLANARLLAEESSVISRLKAIVTLEPALSSSSSSADESAVAGNFLAGTDDTLVVADVQSRLGALALSHKTEIDSARALAAKSVEGLIYIGLKVELRGNLRDVQGIIYDIETLEPFLFVERLTLRLSEQSNFGQPQIPQDAAQLKAELEIYGAKWPRPTAGSGQPQ